MVQDVIINFVNIQIVFIYLILILFKAQDHEMGSASMEPEWPCSQCTYLNEASASVCGICQSPRA